MIAYEELERALARWKARRSGAVEAEAPLEGDPTPSGRTIKPPAPKKRDASVDMDLVDADVDES